MAVQKHNICYCVLNHAYVFWKFSYFTNNKLHLPVKYFILSNKTEPNIKRKKLWALMKCLWMKEQTVRIVTVI